jgi:hypothetical protein
MKSYTQKLTANSPHTPLGNEIANNPAMGGSRVSRLAPLRDARNDALPLRMGGGSCDIRHRSARLPANRLVRQLEPRACLERP